MRFFCIFKPDPNHFGKAMDPEHMAQMGKFVEELTKSGVLLATEGFEPSHKDVRVRLSDGEFTVTDGPFTEAKEIIGGFALLELRSREEAIEMAKRFLKVARGGESEIHELGNTPNLPIEKVGRG